MAELPKWAQNKILYDRRYDKVNKVQAAFKLNKITEPELVEIYQLIPNKAQWFKDCLRQYAADHPEIYTNKKDPEDWPE